MTAPSSAPCPATGPPSSGSGSATWTAQTIRRRVYKSVQALEADIRAWLKNWNQNPKPFAWTETAEEILDSLAKYIAKISGAEH